MIIIVKHPPKAKSNPLGFKGEHMGIFFKQKLTKERFQQAVRTGYLIPIKPPL